MACDHEHFMDLALAEARLAEAAGDTPVAAVIVRDGEVLAIGRNTVRNESNPVNHAEIVAIVEACRKLGTAELKGCTLYSPYEPCPMCCWAIVLSGIDQLVLGGRHAALNRVDLGQYSVERLLEMTGRQLKLVTGIRAREYEDYRRQWMQRTGRLL
jgi:tRNA(adenine34) deaminase